jgi:uncharacterized protein (DUF427 family)
MPLHCWNNVQRWCMQVDGKVNEDAAWYYATPKSAAENIKVGLASCTAGQGWHESLMAVL